MILLATTIVQHTVSEQRLDGILDRRSTNLDNLMHVPVRAFVGSLFWLDGAYWLPYVIGFTIFLATAERWLGWRRFVAVGLTGHVLATLIGQGLVGAAIMHGRAEPELASVVDVGVSYFMAAVIGVLAYGIPRPWRWVYLAGCFVSFGVPLTIVPVTFTDVGHASALLVGLGTYPLTRGRPVLDVTGLLRQVRQRASTLPMVRQRNS